MIEIIEVFGLNNQPYSCRLSGKMFAWWINKGNTSRNNRLSDYLPYFRRNNNVWKNSRLSHMQRLRCLLKVNRTLIKQNGKWKNSKKNKKSDVCVALVVVLFLFSSKFNHFQFSLISSVKRAIRTNCVRWENKTLLKDQIKMRFWY